MNALRVLNQEVVACRRCPRLVEYREQVAKTKRRAYLDWDYWGKPVPGFGDPKARLLLVGLAPGAHGANRTGRMFTGDSSGDFLYRALYKAGFASQPESKSIDDGLILHDAYITAPVRCAPPDNKPLPQEIRNCRPYLERNLELLCNVEIVLALGRLAFDEYRGILVAQGKLPRKNGFVFAHGAEFSAGGSMLICSYHPSQQNTFTGKLTEAMFDALFARIRRILARHARAGGAILKA